MRGRWMVAWTVVALGCASGGLPAEAVEHNAAGAEHLAAGRLDAAEARFRLSLEYHERFSEPRANLGLVALERGDLPAAEEHLRAAVRLNGDFAQAWGNLGVVLERRGRDDGARAAYARALEVDPGLVGPRRNLAFLLARSERWGEARAQLLRLVELSPGDAGAAGLLAYCELRLGRPRAALARAERVLADAPDASTAAVVRGLLRARSGDLEGAVEDLTRASRDPVVGRSARTRLAAVLLVHGRVRQARAQVAELLEEAEDDPAVRLVAASTALETGDHAAARDHARAALRASPDLAHARAVLDAACRQVACGD